MINKATIAMLAFTAATISQSWGFPSKPTMVEVELELEPDAEEIYLAQFEKPQPLANPQTNEDSPTPEQRQAYRSGVNEPEEKAPKPSKPGCRTLLWGCDGHEDECCSPLTCDHGYGIGPAKVCKLWESTNFWPN